MEQTLCYCLRVRSPSLVMPTAICKGGGGVGGEGYHNVRDIAPEKRPPGAATLPENLHPFQLLGLGATGKVDQAPAEEQGVVVVAARGGRAAAAAPGAAGGRRRGDRAAHCTETTWALRTNTLGRSCSGGVESNPGGQGTRSSPSPLWANLRGFTTHHCPSCLRHVANL